MTVYQVEILNEDQVRVTFPDGTTRVVAEGRGSEDHVTFGRLARQDLLSGLRFTEKAYAPCHRGASDAVEYPNGYLSRHLNEVQ